MAYRNGPKIVTDGLVLCLDAAGTKSYPGSGSTWYDVSGNGNNGTITGATFGSGNNGSFSFDGNDYISIPYTSQLAPTAQISFGSWAYLPNWNIDFGTAGDRILSKTESGGYQISAGEGTMGSDYIGGVLFFGGTYRVAKVLKSSISSGWHCLFFTCDGRYFRMYLDGVNVSTYDNTSTTTISYSWNNQLLIGAETDGANGVSGNYWTGKISQISIYDKALSANEVQQNYNATKGRFGL